MDPDYPDLISSLLPVFRENVIFNDPLQIFFLQIMWWNPGTNWVSFASNTKFHDARGDCTRLLKFRGNLRFNIFISQNFNQFFVNFLLDLWMFCQVIQTPCHHWNKNKKMSNIQPSGSLNSQIPKHFGVRKMLLALVDDKIYPNIRRRNGCLPWVTASLGITYCQMKICLCLRNIHSFQRFKKSNSRVISGTANSRYYNATNNCWQITQERKKFKHRRGSNVDFNKTQKDTTNKLARLQASSKHFHLPNSAPD